MSPIDASQLDVTVTEGDRWRRTLNVTVPADVVEAEKGAITRQLASRMKIKGFRSGKVPTSVVAKRYGSAVEREALDQLIRDAYREAISTQDLSPISEGEVEDISFKPKEPLSFKVSFDVRPEVQVHRLGGFKAQRPPVSLPDDALEQVLERLRMQHSTWSTAEEGNAELGDHVEVELQRLDGPPEEAEPKQYEFVLGDGSAIPEIEGAIRTLEPGGQGSFDIRFPDDFPDERLRGEAQQISIRLLNRRVRQLPDLDDTFARSVGDFEGLVALEKKVKDDLLEDAERQSENALRGQLLELVVQANDFEVPRSMVEGYLDSIIGDGQGVDPEKLGQLKEELREDSERAVKRMLLIEHIAEQEGLRAEEDEVDAKVEEIADRMGESASKVYANLQKSGRLQSLEQEITENKLFEFLKSQSEITEAP